MRPRDRRARSASALPRVRRPARGPPPAAEVQPRRAARAVHRAARPATGRRGVGRLAVPGARPPLRRRTSSPTPKATRPLLHRPALDRWTGRRPPAAQARGPQPDRLVQGPGHDGRRHPGAPDRGEGRGLRVDRQHVGLAGRVRRPGGDPRARAGAGGPGGARQAGAVARVRRADAARARGLRRLPPAGGGGEPAARRLPAQLDQPVPARGTEDDRARDAPAARLGAARLDRPAGRQPGQHRGVREGAVRGARAGD